MKTLRAFGALLAVITFAAVPVHASATMSVTKVKGTATLVREGSESPLREGTKLRTGDVIKTAADGTVDFQMNALVGCRILSDGECKIHGPTLNDMAVNLSSGKVVINADNLPLASVFKVETPTAIASVRGTQFSGIVDRSFPGAPRSSFSVRDDAIEVRRLQGGVPTGDPVIVEAGFTFEMGGGGDGFFTRPATGAELAVMEQASLVKTCS